MARELAFGGKIRDVSTGGFCLDSPRQNIIGSKLRIKTKSSDGGVLRIEAIVRWQFNFQQGFTTTKARFLLGCEFANAADHASLMRLADTCAGSASEISDADDGGTDLEIESDSNDRMTDAEKPARLESIVFATRAPG